MGVCQQQLMQKTKGVGLKLCIHTFRDAKTVAKRAAMVDTSALYWAEPSEFSPNRVCRLLPSSVVKVRLSIVNSSTFTYT